MIEFVTATFYALLATLNDPCAIVTVPVLVHCKLFLMVSWSCRLLLKPKQSTSQPPQQTGPTLPSPNSKSPNYIFISTL